LSEAQAAVRAAQSNVDQVNEPARPGTIALAQAGVAQAQADLQAARAALDGANRTLKSPQELLTQLHVWEGKVIAAQGEVKRAEATLAGIQSQIEIAQQDQSNLGKTRLAILQYQREGAQANLLAARTTSSGTQRVIELYRQMLAQPLELIAAQHAAAFQVQVAEAGLNVAQAELAIAQRGPQKEAVALAEAKLRAARASLEIVQAQLKRTKNYFADGCSGGWTERGTGRDGAPGCAAHRPRRSTRIGDDDLRTDTEYGYDQRRTNRSTQIAEHSRQIVHGEGYVHCARSRIQASKHLQQPRTLRDGVRCTRQRAQPQQRIKSRFTGRCNVSITAGQVKFDTRHL
jgi:hypothetical protein